MDSSGKMTLLYVNLLYNSFFVLSNNSFGQKILLSFQISTGHSRMKIQLQRVLPRSYSGNTDHIACSSSHKKGLSFLRF
jgi:hypothetical protein